MKTAHQWYEVGTWMGGTVLSVSSSKRAHQQVGLAAASSGLFSTADGGASWQPVNTGLHEAGFLTVAHAPTAREDLADSATGDLQAALQTAAQNQRDVFASTEQGRLYFAPDGGQTWREAPSWAGLGVITALAFSPNYAVDGHLFAATPEGVFRSLDRGQSWESSTFGLLDTEIMCIACAPDYADSQILWVGTANGGFFRSRNGGRSWRESGTGLPDAAVQCLLISPAYANDERLYVGIEENGVYLSTDGGGSWAPHGVGLEAQNVNCLAAIHHGNQFVAGASNGIYHSADAGQSWQLAQNGELLALAFAELADGSVLAALYGEGVAHSTDGGASWQIASHGLRAHAPPVVIQPGADLLYALDRDGDLARSADGGQSWVIEEIGPCQALAGYAGMGQAAAIAAVDETIFIRRVQSGREQEWRAIATPAREISQLALSPTFDQDETILIGGLDNALFLTQNGGASWQVVSPPRTHDALLQLGLTSPSPLGREGGTPQAEIAICAVTATLNNQNNYQLYLWQSGDKGQSWETLASFESETPAVQLVVPHDAGGQVIFLATQNRLIKLFGSEHDGLAAAQHFFNTKQVDGGQVDGGQADSEEGTDNLRITALTASAAYSADQTLYVGTNRGIYQSNDGGATWHLLGVGLPEQPVVALLPQGQQLRAVLLGGAVWAL